MKMDEPDGLDVSQKRDILYKAGLGRLNRQRDLAAVIRERMG